MKRWLKQGLEYMPAPLPELTLDALRFVRYASVRENHFRRRVILKKLSWPESIVQGPFAGMSYYPRAHGSMILPKLLGTYECELRGPIETICIQGCDRIIDIGAAEGYYAVGMALRNPGVPLICFELNASARYDLRRVARRNGVLSQLDVHPACTPDSLAHALEGARRPAIICDCEGAEDELLDPERVPALRRALILVETHEGMIGGVNQRLLDRFAPTHDVELIRNQPRTSADLPGGLHLTDEEAEMATDGRMDVYAAEISGLIVDSPRAGSTPRAFSHDGLLSLDSGGRTSAGAVARSVWRDVARRRVRGERQCRAPAALA